MKAYTDDFEWLKDSASKNPEHLMASELLMQESVTLSPGAERLCELETAAATREKNEYNRHFAESPAVKPLALVKTLGQLDQPEIRQKLELERIQREQEERRKVMRMAMVMEMGM